eukprot:TRINITY_DN3810_c1_g1_i1.p3 TRINITY_DN3810_c1_g1~~TRINITY_DN3810_c1_g1_i1.p3  ORF type:complete len:118 (+),score=35.08 TRINITY_DN3810_c1_g1_i1:118-471(+)
MKPGFGKNKKKASKKKKQAKANAKSNEMEVEGEAGIQVKGNEQQTDAVEADIQMKDAQEKEKPNLKDALQRKMALKAQIRTLKKSRQKVSKLPKKGALRAAITSQIKDLVKEKEEKK